jgi:crotonobetainyl-CoA:carnitine CoA-transferase CaiB-like acyl-CoA transferase
MPLSGLKVVELANILAGPLIGQFCAELGASVIKVEQPGKGDPTRGWRLPSESADDDVSAYFSCANWGKRSIALDVSEAAGQAVVHELVRQGDVVVMGYKPGDETRFGFDYATLRAINPRLIYLQNTAYGADDPRPGFDAIIQAESGFTYLNGEAGGPPVKMPVALVDVLAAHQLKEGLLLALLKRERAGEGSFVATSLLASATASLVNQATNYLVAGVNPQRMGSEHPNIVPYGRIFRTRDDREFVVAVGTPRQFRAFMDVLSLGALVDDERFADNAARVRHREALNAVLADAIARIDSAALVDALGERKVPFGFVNDMARVFEQPESRRQLFGATGLRSVALQGDFGQPIELAPPPHLNEHGEEILRELGFEAAGINTRLDS